MIIYLTKGRGLGSLLDMEVNPCLSLAYATKRSFASRARECFSSQTGLASLWGFALGLFSRV